MAVEVHIYDYKLKDGKTKRYAYRFEVVSISGKRKWQTKMGFKTKGEAIQAGNEAFSRYNNTGDIPQPIETSFADFLDYWIEHDCKVDRKTTTVDGYEKKIRLYIKPVLGGFKLRAIKKDNLQDLLKDLYNKGHSINTIAVIKGILSSCFNYAVDRNYIPYSPANKLKMPKNQTPNVATRSKPHIYVPKEMMDKIFDRFPEGTVNYIALMLGYKCGLRLGEAFALQWEDVDLVNKTLTVNHQVQWQQDNSRTMEEKTAANGTSASGKGYWYFSNPKYHSVRTIDLDDELVELLTREKAKQDKAKVYYDEQYYYYYIDNKGIVNIEKRGTQINLLNVRESGEYITPRTMQHTSQVIHHKLNYPEFDYHSLRHTHATMLVENGAPPKYVQSRLGHKNINVTYQYYVHLTDSISEQGKAVLNDMYT